MVALLYTGAVFIARWIDICTIGVRQPHDLVDIYC